MVDGFDDVKDDRVNTTWVSWGGCECRGKRQQVLLLICWCGRG